MINGNWTFKAQGFYPVSSNLDGLWMDDRGIIQSLKIQDDGMLLTVIWESNTEKGKPIYTFNSDGTISVLDFVFKNDTWKKFGEANYNYDPNSAMPDAQISINR